MTDPTKGAKRTHKRWRRKDIAEWFAELHRLGPCDIFPDGRNQLMLHTESEKKRFFKLVDQLSVSSDPAQRERIKAALGRIAFGRCVRLSTKLAAHSQEE